MPRQKATVEVKSFVKGLITEASPLNFPDNASIDEDNFILNRDGTRNRRLGMDVEDDYAVITTTESTDTFGEIAYSAFSWKNVAGNPGLRFTVVQIGTTISFFNTTASSPLSTLFISAFPGIAPKYTKCSYAVVDGILVVATGAKAIQIFKFEGLTINRSEASLFIRDQFGVEDIDPDLGYDLLDSSYISYRPAHITLPHAYNLRNQTWGVSRRSGNDGIIRDLISYFYTTGSSVGRANLYPSNADNVNTALYPKTGSDDDAITPRFWPKTAVSDSVSTSPAPRGYFIIDAMERGASRIAVAQRNSQQYPELLYPITSLPEDRTPGGPATLTAFAGRIFFAGFSGQLVSGDNKSPRLSSYVLFSNRVKDTSDINKCYQIGDPTSRDTSDILATDGGFIRVDGAFNIVSLSPIGNELLVIAQNGVWSISGGSDYGFAADNYKVNKISEHGSLSPNSVVVVDNQIIYWGDDGIYAVAPNQLGTLQSTNLSAETIQSFYNAIDSDSKTAVNGIYDSYDRKVRWIYKDVINTEELTRELIFDVTLQSFYPSTIRNGGTVYPKVVSAVEIPPYRISSSSTSVVVGGDAVLASTVPVVYSQSVQQPGSKESLYVTVLSDNPITYTFGLYKNSSFSDWDTLGKSTDAFAFLVTGYISGGDNQREKQVPYITFYLTRTEDGFVADEEGNLQPINQSSCKVQAQWNWTNSANSKRWGVPFQAYRYRRFYMPASSADTYDTGDSLIVTKNKLRGIGNVLSLYIYTDPGKDCKLAGWSMLFGIDNDV